MGEALIPLAVAAGATQAFAQWKQGQNAARSASIEAAQMRANANAEMGIAQRKAEEERRKSNLLESNAIAQAAAYGTGLADPTAATLVSDINARGEYNAQTQLYGGKSAYRQGMYGADVRDWEGRNARRNANMMAFATVLSTAAQAGMMRGGGVGAGAAGAKGAPLNIKPAGLPLVGTSNPTMYNPPMFRGIY